MKNAVRLLVGLAALFVAWTPSDARYAPEWEWRTIRTEHFTLYYPLGHEAFAQRVLSLTDEVYEDVVGYLGVKPPRCPIVLNPGTDRFNGFFSPFPNRISLFETPNHRLRGFGPGSDLVDLVFTHEYTHFVHLTTRLGWFGALTRVIGDGAALANGFSPGWVVEGISTHTETRFTDGGRGRSPAFLGKMGSFAEGKGLWDLPSAGVDSPHSPPGGRFYLAGHSMVTYLNETYGQDAFARLSRFQARHPIGGVRSALRHVTHRSPETFYREFLEDFAARARASKDRAQADELPSGKVAFSESLDDVLAFFWRSPDTLQVLRTGYDKPGAFVQIDAQTGEILSETPTGRLSALGPIRSIPYGRLVFGAVFPDPLGEGALDRADLVVFDPETRTHERLTQDEHVISANLSPDGRTFVAARRNGMWIDLVLLDRNGSHLRPLVSRPGLLFEGPVWSPDGATIAVTCRSGPYSDIVLVDPETGDLRTLFHADPHGDGEPAFSPDGRWIVFTSNRSGIWNIHAWDQAEEKRYQLTSVYYNAGQPNLSPDGKTLAFTSMIRGVHEIVTIPFDPQAGNQIPVEAGTDIPAPDLVRLGPEPSHQSMGIPLWQAYRPYIHTPWLSWDEQGMQAGLVFMGADPLGNNFYRASLLYGLRSERAGYDLQLTNRSFWPTLSARIYDHAEWGNSLGDAQTEWFRERGAEVSLGLGILHRVMPSVLETSWLLGSRIRQFDSLSKNLPVDEDTDLSVGIFGAVTCERTPDAAPRDMVPGWGQRLELSYERAFSELGSEMAGHHMRVSATQFVPSPLAHHGFKLSATYQAQSGLLHYDRSACLPRGYFSDDEAGGLNLRRNLLASSEYQFPIRYTDRGVGLMLCHLDLIKGAMFLDGGAGWDGAFDLDSWTKRARLVVGGSLTVFSTLFSIPLETGIAVGYKLREKEWFPSLIVEWFPSE
ncbi:MAG: hypothetical protein V1800_14745 [Candidatus Latescibacterota bacterium]